MNSDAITIFTDGSSRHNPGPGGFGTIIIAPKNYESGSMNYAVREIGGREDYTTNNRMELMAAIKALQQIQEARFKIQVFSDSSYVINGITKWVHGWQKNSWKTGVKKDVENRDLWERLIEAARDKKIEWKQIGGHVGVAGNVRCDEIATAFADGKSITLYSGILDNYGIKDILNVKHDVEAAKEKSAKRARSNAKAYSYVSLVDGKVLVHKTWAECEARVKAKRGTKYKKVFSAEEENVLANDWRNKGND